MARAEAPDDGAKSRGGRRRARELALQGLYQWLVGGQDAGAILAHLQEDEAYRLAEREYVEVLLRGVVDDAAALRDALTPYLDRAPNALSPVEHAILLIGAYELVHRPEIPRRVVINEAIEIAKSFGGTDGYKYVNGVLDRFAAKARAGE
ncbi:MAG: transcription antitermination factor NusB [Burkholderiales bacterium]|nr:transcription antitermination factor NusB [Burkholderiales bacterium]